MIIYKYLDTKGAKKTLENGAVLLRTPNEFNDPFDCYYHVDEKERQKATDLIINYLFFLTLYKSVVVEGKKLVLGRANTSLLKQNLILLDRIIKKKKQYKFDKQIELFYWISKKISNLSIEDIRNKISHKFDKVFEEIKERFLVSCFSLNNESVLMWSHYAGSHKGACIKYEIDDNDFQKVNYSKNIPNFQLTKALEITLGHDYSKEEVDINNKDFFFMVDPILLKSEDWVYENEVRCVYSKGNLNQKINKTTDKKGKNIFLLNMPRPKAIYLGCKASKRFVNSIKKISGNVPIFKMEIVDNEYKVVPEELD